MNAQASQQFPHLFYLVPPSLFAGVRAMAAPLLVAQHYPNSRSFARSDLSAQGDHQRFNVREHDCRGCRVGKDRPQSPALLRVHESSMIANCDSGGNTGYANSSDDGVRGECISLCSKIATAASVSASVIWPSRRFDRGV